MDNLISNVLKQTTAKLRDAGIESYRQQAETLVSDILGINRIELYLKSKEAVDVEVLCLIQNGSLLRQTGYPLQYITGKTFFYGLEFKVNEDVFIPRPETEILVEAVLNKLSTLNCQLFTILEIGTGCGNIAVSLTKNFPYCRIIAADISKEALHIAQSNARLHNVDGYIQFICGNLFDILNKTLKFDFIISNPPYIKSAELKNLPKEVQFEPALALDGKTDGIFFYKKIIKKSAGYLNEGGFLAFELGDGQSAQISRILKNSGVFVEIEFIKDFNNIERVVIARKDG